MLLSYSILMVYRSRDKAPKISYYKNELDNVL